MSTLPVHIKLIKPGDGTRKVSFDENPSWLDLASKAEELFGVPVAHLGLVYADNEGDKVTLSSQEELTDYYVTAHPPYKFGVRDLSSSREPSAIGDEDNSHLGANDHVHRPDAHSKSPFLGPKDAPFPMMFDIVDDGFPLPLAALLRAQGSKPGGAFVEELGTASRHSTPAQLDREDKGKGRAVPNHTAEPRSPNPRPPMVHIEEVDDDDGKEEPASFLQRVLELSKREKEGKSAPDPPLATIEGASKEPPRSLVTDMANLMQQLVRVVSTHPELSDGVRDILQNVSEGAYWSNTTGQLVNETDEARAGMRLADAIGDLFKTVGGLTSEEIARRAANAKPRLARSGTPPPEGRRGWDRVRKHMFPRGVPRPPPPPGPPFYPGGSRPYYGRAPPPPPPPPPPAPVAPGMPRYPIAPGPPPPPPVVLPPPGHRFDPFHPGNIAALRQANNYPVGLGERAIPPRPGPPDAPRPQPPQVMPMVGGVSAMVVRPDGMAPTPRRPISLDDRRDQLEAAKQAYIEQKEAYRREKDERRREKERLARERSGFAALPSHEELSRSSDEESVLVVPPPPLRPLDHAPIDNDVVHESGLDRAPADVVPERTFSKMEFKYKISPRSHPIASGSGTRANLGEDRIVTRLADMGFTRDKYPGINSRIAKKLRSTSNPSKDQENAIVVSLLEELIAGPRKDDTDGLVTVVAEY